MPFPEARSEVDIEPALYPHLRPLQYLQRNGTTFEVLRTDPRRTHTRQHPLAAQVPRVGPLPRQIFLERRT